MDRQHLRLCVELHNLPHLTESALRTLLLHYGSPDALAQSRPGEWAALGVPAAARASARRWRRRGKRARFPVDVEQQVTDLLALSARVVTICDGAYPALLRAIHDPPPLLYLRGDAGLLQQAQLAVVGSRRPSPAGLRATGELCAQLVAAGLVITSGLALGIDGAAHRGALAAAGRTVAVMATGIDRIYPGRHRGLARDLLERGCLVSEFPPGMPPLRENFPRRNRVVSGLSLGTLVIEAALPSGSLISAQSALEQGREVFALPWSVFHPGGRGCLALLRDGANLVLGAEDVLQQLGPLYRCQLDMLEPLAPLPVDRPGLSREQQRVLDRVGYEAIASEQLAVSCGMSVAEVISHCTALEVKGALCRCPGGYIRP